MICPLCHQGVEVDEETGLITFCYGCEGGIGYIPLEDEMEEELI